MFRLRRVLVLLLAAVLVLGAAPLVLAQDATTPAVTVSDQDVTGGTVTIDSVVSDGPGWIVIHAAEGNSVGADIGHAALTDGTNENVVVTLDNGEADVTETLYAMLHSDLGEEGTYEFPGADTPVQVDGEVVNVPFTVTNFDALDVTAQATETVTATAEVTETAEATATAEVTETAEATATAEMTETAEATETGTPEGPGELPQTGGGMTNWVLPLLAIGILALLSGLALASRRA